MAAPKQPVQPQFDPVPERGDSSEIITAPRPSSRWAGLITLVVGIAGVLLGYILGVSGSASSDPTTSFRTEVTGAPLSEVTASTAAELPVPGEVPSTTVAPARLFDRVPPLQGRRLVASGPRDAVIWRAGAREPTTIPLPVNSWAAWHDTGRHLGYLQYQTASEASSGNVLFIAYEAGVPQPVAIGAISFAWHPTKDRLAWLGPAPPSPNLHAFAGNLDYFGVSDTTIVDLGFAAGDPFAIQLAGFTDAGWVIQDGERIITVSADGTEILERDGLRVATVSPDGRLLIGDPAGTGMVWTDSRFENQVTATVDPGYLGYEWAPLAGSFVAHRSGAGGGSGLFDLAARDEPRLVPLSVSGTDPAITPGGELIVVIADRDEDHTSVVVYELETGRQWVLELAGTYQRVDIGEG